LPCGSTAIDSMVYCVMGDGEIQEGQVWEAALSIPMHKLDHLCAIVDWNKGQIDGQVKDVMNIEPIAEKVRRLRLERSHDRWPRYGRHHQSSGSEPRRTPRPARESPL
jgi:transketolase